MFRTSSPGNVFGEHRVKFLIAAGKFEELVNQIVDEEQGDSSSESTFEFFDKKLLLREADCKTLLQSMMNYSQQYHRLTQIQNPMLKVLVWL